MEKLPQTDKNILETLTIAIVSTKKLPFKT